LLLKVGESWVVSCLLTSITLQRNSALQQFVGDTSKFFIGEADFKESVDWKPFIYIETKCGTRLTRRCNMLKFTKIASGVVSPHYGEVAALDVLLFSF
jgi:hypothetical protein